MTSDSDPTTTTLPSDPAQPTPVSQATPKRHRLGAVDGLRAFAALWVVSFHMRAFSGGKLPPGLDTFVRSGSTGVSLFLVLSGFCLFLPYSGGRYDRFGTKVFLKRRWGRLVPAYYASLALGVLAIVITSGHDGLPRLSGSSLAQQVGAHLALIQQFFPSTFYGLNGAYWSLGLEWEFYLTLPLLIWGARRWGVLRTVAAVVGVNLLYRIALAGIISAGVTPSHGGLATVVLPNLFPGRWGEFAFGMLAAELYSTGQIQLWAHKLRWGLVGLVPLGFAIAGDPIAHLVFGLVFFIVLSLVLANDNVVARLFSWKPIVVLGTMSYSIYLVHTPILEIIGAWLKGLGWSPSAVLLGMIGLLPIVLFVAWLLFVTIERRSMSAGVLESGPGAALLSPKFLRRTSSHRVWPRLVTRSTPQVEPVPVRTPQVEPLPVSSSQTP